MKTVTIKTRNMKTKFLLLPILTIVTLFFISCSNDDDPTTISEYTDATTFFNELDYSGSVLISKKRKRHFANRFWHGKQKYCARKYH